VVFDDGEETSDERKGKMPVTAVEASASDGLIRTWKKLY
jgi:hypothetical protein